MTRTHSEPKTPQQIRDGTDKLINQHRASVQGWLSVHHPGVLAAEVRNLPVSPTVSGFAPAQSKPREI